MNLLHSTTEKPWSAPNKDCVGHLDKSDMAKTHPHNDTSGVMEIGSGASAQASLHINDNYEGQDWKAVGKPPRRPSLSTPLSNLAEEPKDASPDSLPISPARRSSFSLDQKWGSFGGGIQWEGPSIFDDPMSRDVLSVPMVPSVPPRPTMREYRSLSFSMGQNPAYFGYDDYEESFKSSLATMTEEDENVDAHSPDAGVSSLRFRSQSSGDAFGPLPLGSPLNYQNRFLQRGSLQEDLLNFPRRKSLLDDWRADDGLPKSPLDYPQSQSPLFSPGGVEQGWFFPSRAPPPLPASLSSPSTDYTFPEPDPAFKFPLFQRRNSYPIQPITEQLESTHIGQSPPFPLSNHTENTATSSTAPPCMSPVPTAMYARQEPSSLQFPALTSSSCGHLQQVPEESPGSESAPNQEMGKGVLLNQLPSNMPLYMVEFKACRTEYYYVPPNNSLRPPVDSLVIVEADRGEDLGKVLHNDLTPEQVILLHQKSRHQPSSPSSQKEGTQESKNSEKSPSSSVADELFVKQIRRLATAEEVSLLFAKRQDEQRALMVCQQKIKQRKLRMEAVDAEFQWDRRKLTFYFIAERRIDFRELVRELFKTYKTRIWMCAVNPTPTKSKSKSSH